MKNEEWAPPDLPKGEEKNVSSGLPPMPIVYNVALKNKGRIAGAQKIIIK